MLKNLREKAKLSQEKLAFLTGTSVKTISRIENGKSTTLKTLEKLANFFEVSIEKIVENKKD